LWADIHAELRKKGVSLQLLWIEYKHQYLDGYQYSQFCLLYRQWTGKLDVCLRQTHRAGEKLFVDYAGQTISIMDPVYEQIKEAYLFIAALGASSYTFAWASFSQDLPSWVEAHIRAFTFFGGVTQILVPDYVARNIIGIMWPTGLCGP
jgi:transposase